MNIDEAAQYLGYEDANHLESNDISDHSRWWKLIGELVDKNEIKLSMNRNDAKEIAENITNHQLQQMFETAKKEIKDWTKISNVNKSLTKGASWNILAKDFDVNADHHILAKTNMVREFGEFLPEELKLKKPNRKSPITPFHQEPKF